MEPGLHDVELDREMVVDLALSAAGAVMWRLDFTTERLSWTSGLESMLGMASAHPHAVEARLSELIAPLIVTAKATQGCQDLTLEQPLAAPDGRTRWVQFRAQVSDRPDARSVLGIVTDMTSRHEDQVALTDLADRYRLLVELSPEAITVHQDGRVVYVNPAVIRFLRAGSAAEILGRPIVDFVHPDSVPDMLRRIQSLTTPGATSAPAEATLLRFDGGTVDIESISVRTRWEGRPAFQVIMRDVTARNAAAAALRYQAALVTHISDALVATTDDGVVTSWNPAAETVYGYSATDAIGRPVGDVVGTPLDPVAVLEAGGVVQSTHRRADGFPLAMRVSAAQMDVGYVLVCADETARRRAEQHFSTVIAALEEGVVVIGPTGFVESANPAAERILGVWPNSTTRPAHAYRNRTTRRATPGAPGSPRTGGSFG